MAVELATAYVSVIPSTRNMKSNLMGEMAGPAEEAGRDSGARFGGGLTAVAGKAAKVGGVAVAAGFAASLTKGFNRLRAIDDARFKLEGLGHDAATVDAIMSNANESVLGTAFGLEEAATIAASAVAAGIKPGEELARTLSVTGDAATIAGVSLDEMGAIFNVVASKNRLSMQEVNRLGQRGIGVMEMLADHYGVTADEATAMVSRGEVDFATFQNVMEDRIGGAALKAGESFRGSFANMGAAMGRFGAILLGPAFEAAPRVFGAITAGLNKVTKAVEPFVERFSGPLAKGMGVVAGIITAVLVPAMVTWAVQSTITGVRVVASWVATQLAAIKSAAVQVAAVARTVAAWVLMGTQALIQGARVAAGMVIAMGPVGWVIATVVALVALIVANWDTIVAATRKAWDWAVQAVTRAVEAVVGAATRMKDKVLETGSDVLTWFRELPGRIVSALGDLRRLLLSAGKDLIGGFIDGITEMAGAAGRAARDAAKSAVDGAKSFLGISSPSKVFMEIGQQTTEGMVLGIQGGAGDLKKAYQNLVAVPSAPNGPRAPLRTGVAPPAIAAGGAGGIGEFFHVDQMNVGTRNDADELIGRIRLMAATYYG